MLAFFEGVILGVAIFSSLGPKDILVIRQGASGGTVRGVVLICILADVVLIALGVMGIGPLLKKAPEGPRVILLSGACYLLWFAWQRLRACIHDQSMPRGVDGSVEEGRVLRVAVVVGFANPYAWLDTVLLIGSVGAARPEGRMAFSAGAMTASLIWFASLGAVSKRLKSFFRSSRAWRFMDAAIAAVVAYLSAMLLKEALW